MLLLVMNDSFGDGWNGNVLTVGGQEFTLSVGASATVELGTCVFECNASELAISVEGGDENFGFVITDIVEQQSLWEVLVSQE